VIAIIDYGAGNLTSVRKAFEHLGADVCVTSHPLDVARAAKLVLPGVGHFSATAALRRDGMQEAILNALRSGTPFLGICVGMQWLFEGSAEAPQVGGARLLRGVCAPFPQHVKSPHVGWNSIEIRPGSRLLRGVRSGAFVYYAHSFFGPVTGDVAAETEYGITFAAAVERDEIFGVQFHPEKSGATGLAILNNFCEL